MAAQFSASAYVGIYHILREASVFARSTEMGNTRASDSGTGNGTDLTFFFNKKQVSQKRGS
jgi:hypothetical protein